MNLSERIAAFDQLGKNILTLNQEELASLTLEVQRENPWFTPPQVSLALKGIMPWLQSDALNQWMKPYGEAPANVRTIGVAMAGNIPLVGFHDFLCVLMAGHRLKMKLSSQDTVLMKYILEQLRKVSPALANQVKISERLNGADAMIATGSDNTARYFEYYFRNVPHIIRKNRSSCAVVLGEETRNEIKALGTDVFSYFGLGCRNVSKLFVPENHDLTTLFEPWSDFQPVIDHHKYFNNYEYQKSILLINKIPFYDNGFVLVKEDQALVSPISVIFYESYRDQPDLKEKITQHQNKIQCIVSARKWFEGSEDFGEAQFPRLTDYADKLNTMNFLMKL